MKSVSRIALGVAFVIGGASAAPALAKKDPPAPAAAPAQRQLKISKEERAALAPLQLAVTAKDWAKAASLLPAAEAAAQGPDAKYALGQFELAIGLGTSDEKMQARAIDTMIASGGAPADQLSALYRNQGSLALRASNMAGAEAAYGRLLELTPNDPDAMVNLAKIKSDARKPQEAVALIERAIAAKQAQGQVADISWYRYALKLAYDNRMKPESMRLSRLLIAAYPTKENWRDALLIYRDLNTLDKGTNIDLLRLMRTSKALNGERDWFELAEALDGSGLPGESAAVLQEGSSLRMVDLNKPVFRDLMRSANGRIAADKASLASVEAKARTAATGTAALNTGDAYFGYGNYAKAADLYRLSLSKGGVDPNVANTHLGMALALAGDRAGAEAAFRTVQGPRSDVAAFWLNWLSQPHA